MFKKTLWFCCLASCAVIIAGCYLPPSQTTTTTRQHYAPPVAPATTSSRHTQYVQGENYAFYANRAYRLPYFSRLVIGDGLAVNISTGAPTMYFSEPPPSGSQIGKDIKEHANIEATFIGTTLYIKKYHPTIYYNPNKPHELNFYSSHRTPVLFPTIILHVPALKMLTAKDQARVTAQGLMATDLQVYALNSAAITLDGDLNIKNVVQKSRNKIEAKWLEGERLEVSSYASGPIYLAGEIDALSATLSANSYLDARYLRTQNAAVLATDNARADVYAKNILNAFADDHSNIYYYKRPLTLNKVTEDSGNVLHLETLP